MEKSRLSLAHKGRTGIEDEQAITSDTPHPGRKALKEHLKTMKGLIDSLVDF